MPRGDRSNRSNGSAAAAASSNSQEASLAAEQLACGEGPRDKGATAATKSYGGNSRGRSGSGAASPHDVATPSRAGSGRGGGSNRNSGGESGAERERPMRGQPSALEELMRRRGVDEAWNALEDMQRQGAVTDKYTVSRMLMKTVGDGRTRLNPQRVYRGISLVERFVEMQPTDVDEVLFNALLDTCCRLKDLTRLEATVQRMRDLKITPSPVTLGILVKTYGQAGDIQKVLQVWSEMEKQRGQANAVTYGCMIDACVKCGHLDKAIEIFQGMRQVGKHRNTIIYTTLIKGYGLEKDLKSALELFREMPQEGVPYNTITYNSIIDACVKGGDLTTAEQLLNDITAPGSQLTPDLITFSTLLKGYCHIGDLDKALQVAQDIKKRGLRCDELVYNTLMDGCVKANDVPAGVGLFEEMVQQGMRPSAITHSILVRLYQRAGYEEDASEAVAQLYQHHGIERPTGGDRARGPGPRASGRHYGMPPVMGRGGPGGSDGMRRDPGASPMGSPHAGCWGGWSDSHDTYGDPSAQSTPMGSPMAAASAGGLFLPLEAVRGMPPMGGGGDTPYANSTPGQTPMGSGYPSISASPYMSPAGPEQHQAPAGQVMAIPASPASTQLQPMAACGQQSLPPWPFVNGGAMQGGGMQGALPVQPGTMPAAPMGTQHMGTPMATHAPQGMEQMPCFYPVSVMPQGPTYATPSPPHEIMQGPTTYCCPATGVVQQSQQVPCGPAAPQCQQPLACHQQPVGPPATAHFEGWAMGEGMQPHQASGTLASTGSASPFGL